jgi:hypothetical protein
MSVKTEQLEKKARPIRNIANTALRKEEMAVHLYTIRNRNPQGRTNMGIDPFLRN